MAKHEATNPDDRRADPDPDAYPVHLHGEIILTPRAVEALAALALECHAILQAEQGEPRNRSADFASSCLSHRLPAGSNSRATAGK